MSEPGEVSTLEDAVRLLVRVGMSVDQVVEASGVDREVVEQVLAEAVVVDGEDSEAPVPAVERAFPTAAPVPAPAPVGAPSMVKHGLPVARGGCGGGRAAMGGVCGCVSGGGAREADLMRVVW